MDFIKREGECCCCFSNEDLFGLYEPYNFEEKVEIYSTMIADCFQIELSSYIKESNRNLYMICKNCVFRLRDAIALRSQVQIVYDRLHDEHRKKNDQGDIVDTKENILNYTLEYDKVDPLSIDIAEYCKKDDMATKDNMLKCESIDSKASLSDDNDQLKAVLVKINNKKMKNVTVVSTSDRFKKLKIKSQPSNVLLCNICKKQCGNSRAMRSHMKVHRRECLQCDYCGNSYNRRDYFISHIRAHANVEKFICDICKRFFRQKDSLTDHIMLHMGMLSVKCEICKRDFVSEAALGRHVQSNHVESESCEHCNKSFGNKRALRQHVRIHSKNKDWTCNVCGKTLGSKTTFKNHCLMHSGVKSHKCELCEKAFVTRPMLANHMRKHIKRKWTCKHCNKAFVHHYELLRHENTHLGIKNLICDHCGRGFIRKYELRRHIMSHVNKKIIRVRSKKNIKSVLC